MNLGEHPKHPTIGINPPLSFESEQLGSGKIKQARRDSLTLHIPMSRVPPGETQSQIEVAVASGKRYRFDVRFDSQTQQARIINEHDLEQMDELLGVLRKDQHINICASQNVEATDRYTGFSEVSFSPTSIPDLCWSELDTTAQFLNREFAAPLLITGMTGGIEQAALINQRLASAAAAFQIPMGVGSQRLALDNPQYEKIFKVKQHAPNLFLIGNIGLAQLNKGYDLETCQRAVDMIEADALAIHVNVLQEVVQVEGDRDFRNLFRKIEKICTALSAPVVIKEVGTGLDPLTAKRLFECGVTAVDVAGKGGTSWSHIEGLRSDSPITTQVASTFRDWGIPTAFALCALKNSFPEREIVATGGIRNGLEVAKAIALGAQMVGVGLPLLKAALESEKKVSEVLGIFLQGLKTAMICTNSSRLQDLSAHIRLGNHPMASELPKRMENLNQWD